MKIKEGDKIPNSEFYHLDETGAPKKISTSELFDNNKTIVIGVPGAFTKVCSAKHLPGYVNNFEAAKKKGITKIICVSVNDPNVMKAWGDSQKVEDKIFTADISQVAVSSSAFILVAILFSTSIVYLADRVP